MAVLFLLYIPALQGNSQGNSSIQPSVSRKTENGQLPSTKDGNGDALTESQAEDEVFEAVEQDVTTPLLSNTPDTPQSQSEISPTAKDKASALITDLIDDSQKDDSETPSISQSRRGTLTKSSEIDLPLNASCIINDEEKPTKGSVKIKNTVDRPLFELGSPSHFEQEGSLIVEEFAFTEATEIVLEELGLTNDVWKLSEDKECYQISFIVPSARCDQILRRMTEFGIGRIHNTSISVFPAKVHETYKEDTEKKKLPSVNVQFTQSIKSQIIVNEVIEGVRSSSLLTFDYLLFVILASIIASIALAENSSVVLVASMLVSPIMGPILGGVFGIVLRHETLWRIGVKNEAISLGICLAIGFVVGLVTGGVNLHGSSWGSTDDWPTSEMKSRGMLRSLWVGVLIALPSGAGVALSVLGGNAGSLVGVAISASLLPPAVNAGMLWAYACLAAIVHPAVESIPLTQGTVLQSAMEVNATYNTTTVGPTVTPPPTWAPPNCPALVDNLYEPVYSCYMPYEAAILGLVSLFLTFLNIICIFIMGVLFLKIKEVAPERAVPEYSRRFWKNDIRVARNVYLTMKPNDGRTVNAAAMAKSLAKDYRDLIFPDKTESMVSDDSRNIRRSWHNLIQAIEEDEEYRNVTQNLGAKNPKFLRQMSEAGCSLMERLADQAREGSNERQAAFTITSTSDIMMLPMRQHTPGSRTEPNTPEAQSPTTAPLGLTPTRYRAALVESPTGVKPFIYDQTRVLRPRERRLHGRKTPRQVSMPAEDVMRLMGERLQHLPFKPLDGATEGMKREVSSGRFTITTIGEEN